MTFFIRYIRIPISKFQRFCSIVMVWRRNRHFCSPARAVLLPQEYARLQDQLMALWSDSTKFSLSLAALKISLTLQRRAGRESN